MAKNLITMHFAIGGLERARWIGEKPHRKTTSSICPARRKKCSATTLYGDDNTEVRLLENQTPAKAELALGLLINPYIIDHVLSRKLGIFPHRPDKRSTD